MAYFKIGYHSYRIFVIYLKFVPELIKCWNLQIESVLCANFYIELLVFNKGDITVIHF